MEKDFKNTVVPTYRESAHILYNLPKKVSDSGLQRGLEFDTFLFVLFHELFHPIVCPNSKDDQKMITKSLYDGIKECEPFLSKRDVFYKVNNCKNLIWDVVVNLNFLSRVSGIHEDRLSEKISYVFRKRRRKDN